jgi:serine/threonine-protein kinase
MLTPQGQIKLIDFGIARLFKPGRSMDTEPLGTPGFAPPEQWGKTQTDGPV